MPQANPYTALIILTAGRSSRMGEPKALLRFGNRTALEIAVNNAVQAGVQRVVAVVGHRAEEIRAAHSFTGLGIQFEWAINLESDSPMIASLQTGLRDLESFPIDAFLFQPVDLPLITADDLSAVLGAFSTDDSGARVFVPTCEGNRGHPVLCTAELAAAFLALGPEQSARDLIAEQKVVGVETGNPGVLLDMDAPDEYRQLKTIYMSRQR